MQKTIDVENILTTCQSCFKVLTNLGSNMGSLAKPTYYQVRCNYYCIDDKLAFGAPR